MPGIVDWDELGEWFLLPHPIVNSSKRVAVVRKYL